MLVVCGWSGGVGGGWVFIVVVRVGFWIVFVWGRWVLCFLCFLLCWVGWGFVRFICCFLWIVMVFFVWVWMLSVWYGDVGFFLSLVVEGREGFVLF